MESLSVIPVFGRCIFKIYNNKFYENLKNNLLNVTQKEFSNKYNFDEVELKKDQINFYNGFPIIKLEIRKNEIEVSFTIKNVDKSFVEVDFILNKILVSIPDELTISKYEIGSMLNFENDNQLSKFFTCSIENDFIGEIHNSNINLNTTYNGKKIKYLIGFNENGFSIISIESPSIIKKKTFIREMNEIKDLLDERLEKFLHSRNYQT